jgi:L-threonylcarbamoyladenylate synthase
MKLMQIEINKALKTLQEGGLILYPTDTVWGIGCDATNFDAVKKIYALKQRAESKSMICLVSDFNMLRDYVPVIPEIIHDTLKNAKKPTTVIYNHPVKISKNLIATDDTLAIRIVEVPFCNELIKKFNKPIVSTSANISTLETPKSFKEIHEDILKGVDYVVNLHREKKSATPSMIIKLIEDGTIDIIRR